VGNWNTSDLSDEDMDQDVQQNIAAAAAQSVGIDMGNYDFGDNFNPSDYSSDILGITNSFMADPNAAARTAMAIRQSYPVYSGNMRPALNSFINRYTTTRGPLTRDAYNRAYDITRTNLGGINTLGYDTAKALQRVGIGSGQVKSANPTAGRLTGTVFKDGVISKNGVMQGVASDVYYGAEDLDNKYEGLPRYSDKGYLGPDGVSYSSPEERALSRAYDQYMNPYNKPGELGYNPDVKNIGAGEVRPGLQSGIFSDMSGTPTQLGPVATYDRNYSGMDNLAMTAFGGMGHLARALTNKVTGIEGQPLPAAALAPTPEMIAQGQTSGGMARSFSQIPGQIKQGIESLIAPNVPAPNPVQTAPLDLSGFEQRFGSTNPLSGETSVTSAPSSIVDGLNGFQTEKVPGGRRSVNTIGDMTEAEAEAIKNRRGAYNFYSDPEVEVEYPSATTGEQLAGSLFDSLFRDPNISPEAREILKEKGMTIDDLFAPKTPTPEPEKPNIMDLIQGVIQTSALGGPATANRLAQVDYSNLTNVGGNLYQARPKTSRLDSILESLGMKASPSGPSAQIYSGAKKPQSLFDYIGFGQ
jgi:hypothetical protein